MTETLLERVHYGAAQRAKAHRDEAARRAEMEWIRGVVSHDELRALYVEADYYEAEWDRFMLNVVSAWHMAEAHRQLIEARTTDAPSIELDVLLDHVAWLDTPEHSFDTSVVEAALDDHGAHAPPVVLVATSTNGGPPT